MTVEMEGPEPEAVRRARSQVRALGIASAVLLVFGLLGLTVVGKSPRPSKQALSVVLSAAERTAGATSARFAISSQSTVQDHAIPGPTAEGVASLGAPSWVQGTIRMGPLTFEVITDGKTEFLKMPATQRPPRTPWVAIDISALQQAGQFGASNGLTLPGGGDPAATLVRLRAQGMVKSAASGGSARVRGTSTRVYHLVLNATQFKDAAVGRAQAAGFPATNSLVGLEFKDPLVDLYVDGQGLIRRMTTTVETHFSGQASGSATLSAATQVDFYDFGTPVHIQAPPANQVTRLGSLAELGALLNGGR